MSDFLQFNLLDRVPSLPNRKKITFDDDTIQYARIEYADEPIEEGTKLNKATFDKLKKLNTILGYNSVTGQWNPITATAEFTIENDISNFLNNQKLLLQCMNKVLSPATEWNVIQSSTTLSTNFTEVQLVELNNGNIMFVGYYGSTGYFLIKDKTGQTIKSSTSLGTSFYNPQILKMSDGNIMIVGSNGDPDSSSSGRIIILDQDGNTLYGYATIGAIYLPQIKELKNGNIIVVGYGSGGYGHFIILDKSGNVVKSNTNIARYFFYPQLLEMSNGNIMIIGTNSNGKYYIAIIDSAGNIIKEATQMTDGFNEPKLIEMSNGNIMIVGNNGNNGRCEILDKSGNIIKPSFAIGTSFQYSQIAETKNHNIIITGDNTSTSSPVFEGFFTILDTNGNTIKSSTSLGQGNFKSQILIMSSGNIMIVGGSYSTTTTTGYLKIIDTAGNIIKEATSIGTGYYYPQILEMSDGNIMIVGNQYGSGTSANRSTGYYFICEPISTGLSANSTINEIPLDTMLKKDKYYELIYNEALNKFIAEEMRV